MNGVLKKWHSQQDSLTKQILTKHVMSKVRWFDSHDHIFRFKQAEDGLWYVYNNATNILVAMYDPDDESYRFTDVNAYVNLHQLNDLLQTANLFPNFV